MRKCYQLIISGLICGFSHLFQCLAGSHIYRDNFDPLFAQHFEKSRALSLPSLSVQSMLLGDRYNLPKKRKNQGSLSEWQSAKINGMFTGMVTMMRRYVLRDGWLLTGPPHLLTRCSIRLNPSWFAKCPTFSRNLAMSNRRGEALAPCFWSSLDRRRSLNISSVAPARVSTDACQPLSQRHFLLN